MSTSSHKFDSIITWAYKLLLLSCGTPAVVYAGTACEEIARQYGGQVIAIGDFRKLLL